MPLICPGCGLKATADVACCCRAATRLEVWNGVPRLLFGQSQAGEFSHEQMTRILVRMEEVSWKQALREIAPQQARQECGGVGPDLILGLPWDETHNVLEVGSGLGQLTALLAERATRVISVESNPQLALFQCKRAQEDGLPNWHPVIASSMALPFPAETFDLVALNGSFETLGIDNPGDPGQLQSDFLKQAFRLLKPRGYLYLGVRTRFGLNVWRGQRDESSPAWMGLLPRLLADWYCRRGRSNESSRGGNGYRASTHTPARYARMVKEAGFAQAEIFGAHDSCRRHLAVYPLGAAAPRRVTRAIADPPPSRKGKLLRWFADRPGWYDRLEDNLVLLAQKQRTSEPLFWADLPHRGLKTQFSTSNKVLTLSFEGARPATVFITPKNAFTRDSLAREFAFLRSASECHPEATAWPLRWPTPLQKLRRQGHAIYQYEFALGMPLNRLLMPVELDVERFAALFGRLAHDYVDLCGKLTRALPKAPPACWDAFLAGLAEVDIPDREASARIRDACGQRRGQPLLMQAVHGDLALCNTIVLPEGSMVLIDWENVSAAGLVAIDLLRLWYDTCTDARHLKAKLRQEVLRRARQATRAALERLGIEPGAYDFVEAVFVAHQVELGAARAGDPRRLLQAFKDRAFTLDS